MDKSDQVRRGVGARTSPALVVTVAVLVLAFLAVGAYTWITLSSAEMSLNGGIALVLGILGTVALGVGLMGLIFFSSRQGYDERVGGRRAPEKRD